MYEVRELKEYLTHMNLIFPIMCTQMYVVSYTVVQCMKFYFFNPLCCHFHNTGLAWIGNQLELQKGQD